MTQILSQLGNTEVLKNAGNFSLADLVLTARSLQKANDINNETPNSPMAYAANPVATVFTLWTILASLQESVEALSNSVMLADAAALANASNLEAKSSQYAATVAANDNAYMQGLGVPGKDPSKTGQNDKNYTNNMNAAQNAASTHQTEIQPSTSALNTTVQSATNQMSADGNTQASLLGVASALLQLTPGLR